MTQQEFDDIITYFKDKPLADSIDEPGLHINNCKSFVSSNILRMTVGTSSIQKISYSELDKLRRFLDKKSYP